ncbi:hypothetical protein P7K49_026656 [Saguinus oedipus]|uniref:Uncharacterized protein n=1 Tax=Saguinus oedipus TaxID=9490 RepID=A0ABQ9UDZ4_SAGOE|nr:hypothetical protein P7K49_026656 [Saguinus oedipus]
MLLLGPAALENLLSQIPKRQIRKGRARGLRTTSFGWRFRLWSLGLFCPERHLARRLKNNSFYPFEQQQPNGALGGTGPCSWGRKRSGLVAAASSSPARTQLLRAKPWRRHPRLRAARASSHAAPPLVFVLEYYLDTLWKGMLLFIVCAVLVSVSSLREV